MPEKCNIPAERAAELISRPEFSQRSKADIALFRKIFSQYLIVENISPSQKLVKCTTCEESGVLRKRSEHDLYDMFRESPEIFRKKHNDMTNCPFCGERVQVKNKGMLRSGASLYQTTSVSFINVSVDGELFMDSGIGFWDYDGDMGMDATFSAKRRYYFSKSGVMAWKRSISVCPSFWYTGPTAWEAMKNIRDPSQTNWMYQFDGYGYLIGQERVRESQLKYSAVEKYYADYHNVDLTNDLPLVRLFPQYLAAAAKSPQVEMAVKLGMADMVGARIRDNNSNRDILNWRAKNPADFLRMSKRETRAVLTGGMLSVEALRAYHRIKAQEPNTAPEKIMQAVKLLTPANVTGRLAEECAAVGLPIMQVAGYIQADHKRLKLWVDYISMARQLDFDLTNKTVLLPKDLQARHDAAADMIKAKEDAALLEAYQKRKEDLTKRYAFRYAGLQVVIPATQTEIVREGKTLGHCVGGYAPRHFKGATTILFIRRERKPETPFLTVELDAEGNMRQIHGYKNERYPHAVSPLIKYGDFIATWQNWYRHGSRRDRNGNPIIKERKQTA